MRAHGTAMKPSRIVPSVYADSLTGAAIHVVLAGIAAGHGLVTRLGKRALATDAGGGEDIGALQTRHGEVAPEEGRSGGGCGNGRERDG